MDKNDSYNIDKQTIYILKEQIYLQKDIIHALGEFRDADEGYSACVEECKNLNAKNENYEAMNEARLILEVKKSKLFAQMDEYQIKMRFMEI